MKNHKHQPFHITKYMAYIFDKLMVHDLCVIMYFFHVASSSSDGGSSSDGDNGGSSDGDNGGSSDVGGSDGDSGGGAGGIIGGVVGVLVAVVIVIIIIVVLYWFCVYKNKGR